MADPLPPARPIPLKERAAMVFVGRAQVEVKDSAFVVIDAEGMRTVIPVGGLACLMLEPGVRISHAAVGLAAQAGTLITWVGEGGVRLYSAGQPGGARADKLLWQAALALDEPAPGGAGDVRPSLWRGPARAALGRSAARHRGAAGAAQL